MRSTTMTAPVSGKCVPLQAIYNSTYSSGDLGQGIAILPTEGTVSAPFDCVVTRVSESRHCVVVSDTETNYEVLIAADFSFYSDAFHLAVAPGQKLSKGDVLFTMDLEKIDLGVGSVSVPCVFAGFTSTNGMNMSYGDAVRGETTVLTCAG
ncbi:MAG: PTS glucose transporter subunit IIA [Eubacteriales bacterium]|nr:PTS glucose transporter subunit IIA [Eubacteriales bacterium]